MIFDMKYILRIAKLKTYSNIQGSAKHNLRECNVKNCDKEKTKFNEIIGCNSSREIKKTIRERIDNLSRKPRKDAVICLEYLITASPDFFKHQSIEKNNEFFKQSMDYISQIHGSENVISAIIQYDETTPHMSVYVVPINHEKNILSASYYIDGKEKLSQLQTDFYENCGKQFELERGKEKSKAKHQTIRQFYTDLNQRKNEYQKSFDIGNIEKGVFGYSTKDVDELKKEFEKLLEKNLNQEKIIYELNLQNERALNIKNDDERLFAESYYYNKHEKTFKEKMIEKEKNFNEQLKEKDEIIQEKNEKISSLERDNYISNGMRKLSDQNFNKQCEKVERLENELKSMKEKYKEKSFDFTR